MNKGTKGIIVVLAVTIPAIIVAIALTVGKSEAPSATDTSMQRSTSSQEQASNQPAAPVDATDSKNVDVELKDFAYSPEAITVKVGTTVTWTNQDSMRHDVVATNPSPDAPNSDLFGKGESYSFTFNKPGTYEYFCTPHPYMKGKVVVTE